MVDHQVTVSVSIEGLGDAEEHTISSETAERVDDIIKTDLRDRYCHLDADTDIDIIALSPPNSVAIHYDSGADGASDTE